MHYRRLGHTDLDVSLICLGTMTWGEQNSEAEAHAQLDLAIEHGVNFIDTAELYPVPPRAETYGLTEQYIGTWLQQRGQRERIILATKVAGPTPVPTDMDLSYMRNGPTQVDRDQIDHALEGSLRRLQTDYIDLYQVHWPARRTNFFGRLGHDGQSANGNETPILETLNALDRHVRAGRIRYIGLSNETPWGLAEYLRLAEQHDLPRVVSVQNPYNLLNRSYEVGLAEFAPRSGVGLLAYSPLAFGVLSGKYLGNERPEGARLTRWQRFGRYLAPEAMVPMRDYIEVAQHHGLDPAQMALAYVNSRSFVTSNIIGATTIAQLNSNLSSVELTLPDSAIAQIEAIHCRQPNPCP